MNMRWVVGGFAGALGLAGCGAGHTPANDTAQAPVTPPAVTAPATAPEQVNPTAASSVAGQSNAQPAAAVTNGFDRTLELLGITFRVSSANDSSINQLKIEPKGLQVSNETITKEIDGAATDAEIADINADGSPELYVYVNSAGSGSYGSLVAYSANNRKSLSEIYLPPVADNPAANKGYMGHDEFAVVENRLVQRFPIYKDGDSNSKASGKTRQIQYKLQSGEASWQLVPDKIIEY
jgi:hypothetical protein